MDINKQKDIKVGGYNLPADFQCITLRYLTSLTDLSFEERISSIYVNIFGENLPDNLFGALKNAEFPASVVSVDQGLAVLELFDGDSASYIDYMPSISPKTEILTFTSVLISSYVDLVDSGLIFSGDKINLAFNGDDGRVLLSAWLAKRVGLPINVLLVGAEKPIDEVVKNVYIESPMDGDITTLISGLYEETDCLLDPLSTYGLVSYDLYYADYEDDLVTLLLGLVSPYLYSRQVLKHAFNINEISVEKAISKLNSLTAIDLPSGIENKTLQPFYKLNTSFSLKNAIEIIKHGN